MFVRDRIRIIGYVEAAEFHSVLLNYGDEKRAVEPPGVLVLLSIHISFLALSELDPSQSRDKFSERNALFVSAYMNMNEDLRMGRYLNDVRTEGGRGVSQYVTNNTDRLRECVTKGGRGSKIPKI